MLFRAVGAKIDVSLGLDGLAAFAAMRGDTERAARLFGTARGMRETIGVDLAEPTNRATGQRPAPNLVRRIGCIVGHRPRAIDRSGVAEELESAES